MSDASDDGFEMPPPGFKLPRPGPLPRVAESSAVFDGEARRATSRHAGDPVDDLRGEVRRLRDELADARLRATVAEWKLGASPAAEWWAVADPGSEVGRLWRDVFGTDALRLVTPGPDLRVDDDGPPLPVHVVDHARLPEGTLDALAARLAAHFGVTPAEVLEQIELDRGVAVRARFVWVTQDPDFGRRYWASVAAGRWLFGETG